MVCWPQFHLNFPQSCCTWSEIETAFIKSKSRWDNMTSTGGLNHAKIRFGWASLHKNGATFSCLVRSHPVFPEIIYSWVFNEFPSFVAEDSRRFISQHTGNLYISKVQPSDVGIYICLVKNTVTNTRVLSPPTPLTLKTDGEACMHLQYLRFR